MSKAYQSLRQSFGGGRSGLGGRQLRDERFGVRRATSLLHSASWQDEQSMRRCSTRPTYDNPGNHSIVGMWSFNMTPTAGPGDFGYQQWHSDGTELMNSGGRAPATQNFCMGVWRQTGADRATTSTISR